LIGKDPFRLVTVQPKHLFCPLTLKQDPKEIHGKIGQMTLVSAQGKKKQKQTKNDKECQKGNVSFFHEDKSPFFTKNAGKIYPIYIDTELFLFYNFLRGKFFLS
jgi:hypothetical protein